MRVVCDNCGATYKIPDSKLTKEVNKATCRKCGHRMLIRRAQPAPATAAVAAAPAAASDKESTQIRKPPTGSGWEDDGPTRVARVQEDEVDRPTMATEPSPVPPAPPPPQAPAIPAPAQPAPAPVSAAPAPQARPARATFDRRSDLSWAAFGSLVAVSGALLLAFNITNGDLQRFLGLGLALFGSLMSLMVLLTSGRGERKASIGISFVVATVLGLGTAVVIHGVFTTLYGMNERIEQVMVRTPPKPAEDPARDEVLAALTDNADEEEDAEEATAEDTANAVAAAAPVEPAAPAPAPAPQTTKSAPEARPAPAPAPKPAPAPAPAPEPEPQAEAAADPSLPARLETSVVEVMIRSNKRIKRCWMDEKQRSGVLPRRVDVKFTVQPTGRVSSARSATEQYKGTDFEICLGDAFRQITFPPFAGEPLSMTYNFAL